MNKLDLTVLGFDFGLKRIGVAVGQSVTKTAMVLDTLMAKQGKPNWQDIISLVEEWRPGALIVGVPLNMDGSEQPITKGARKFANQLKERFDLPVELVDERLTTKAARSEIFSSKGYKGLQKLAIDGFAAKIIVEDWLRNMPVPSE